MQQVELLKKFKEGEYKALARCITMVENELPGFEDILLSLNVNTDTPVIGITGPPGAGKSTLVNALIDKLSKEGKRIGVVAVDPTSPFNFGSLLGDRIRMSEHFNNPDIYIRSIASRGSLGGLSAKIIEVIDVMKSFGFDYVFVETVGVGQSEVEIAGLADTTILLLVPEAGDEVQTIKSGIMEIADIYVVNKSDRPDAGVFVKNLNMLLHEKSKKAWNPPVLKATASKGIGIDEIISAIHEHKKTITGNELKPFLLAEKAYKLIQIKRMKDIDKTTLISKIKEQINHTDFNIYQFVQDYLAR